MLIQMLVVLILFLELWQSCLNCSQDNHIDELELEKICQEIVEKNKKIVENQKERAIGPLMGIAMKELRGKASGEIINKLLLKNIKSKLENN